jgi:hypothetical protein
MEYSKAVFWNPVIALSSNNNNNDAAVVELSRNTWSWLKAAFIKVGPQLISLAAAYFVFRMVLKRTDPLRKVKKDVAKKTQEIMQYLRV